MGYGLPLSICETRTARFKAKLRHRPGGLKDISQKIFDIPLLTSISARIALLGFFKHCVIWLLYEFNDDLPASMQKLLSCCVTLLRDRHRSFSFNIAKVQLTGCIKDFS